jgi:hypothetical protein
MHTEPDVGELNRQTLHRFDEIRSADGIEALQHLSEAFFRVLVTASDDSHARTSCESLR